MTDRYVDSAAVGAADGTTKADAYVTLGAALTAAAAGDRIFCSHTHAESTAAAITLTSAGIISNYVHIFSVNFSGSTPPVAADLLAGAEVNTGAGAYNITFAGFATSYGVNYRAGVASSATASIVASSAAATEWIFDTCTLELASSGASSRFTLGNSTSDVLKWTLKNVVLKFGATTQTMNATNFILRWIGGSVSAAGQSPTTLFANFSRLTDTHVEGVDLSHISGIIFSNTLYVGRAVLRRCKLHASATVSTAPTNHFTRFEAQNCNSGDVNYYNSIIDYYGTLTPETTIVRTGGASDGTTPIAHKIVTTANAAPETPFRSMPIEFWNETLSAITVTLQGIWGGGAVPDDDEIWVEADYLGTSGFPISTRVSDRMTSLISTPAGQAAGSGTWGGSTTKFALSVTFTPAEKGLVTLNVMVGVGSGTFYVDPKPVVT